MYDMEMKHVDVSELREHCLSVLDELPAEGVVITSDGEPIARLQPFRDNDGDLIGSLAGQLGIQSDIFSTGERWDAEP